MVLKKRRIASFFGIYILVDTYMRFLERGREFLSPFGRTIGFAVRFERSGPPQILICGESGGIERFQLAKRVLCASIAERERKLLKQVVDVVD